MEEDIEAKRTEIARKEEQALKKKESEINKLNADLELRLEVCCRFYC